MLEPTAFKGGYLDKHLCSLLPSQSESSIFSILRSGDASSKPWLTLHKPAGLCSEVRDFYQPVLVTFALSSL